MCYNNSARGAKSHSEPMPSSYRDFLRKAFPEWGRMVKAMKITIYGKQMSVRESLKSIIEKKLQKFNKFFGDDTEAFVTCRVRKGVKIIEITVNYGGTTFRSEEESETFITALDRSVESLERQIRKNKTRLEKSFRQEAFVITEDDDDGYDEEGEFEIRVKTFAFKPMTPEEAVLQMNLLGHTFYAFTDADSAKVCVVYKRREGSYGMIVPE
jgi:putative sigma-54 modulation protein